MSVSSKSKNILKQPFDRGDDRKKSAIDISSFKYHTSPNFIKTTTTTINFKTNKRRRLKMLQRIVTSDDEIQSDESSMSYRGGTRNINRNDVLSTSKYGKVSIILNNIRIKRESMYDPEKESQEDMLSTSKYKKVNVIIDGMKSSNGSDSNDFTAISTDSRSDKIIKTIMKRRQIPTSISPPDGWESIYSLVEELRKDKSAPIDAVGAEELPEKHRGDVVFRFQVLISLMLSSQTKDEVVAETIKALQKHGLDVQTINQTSTEKINQLIQKVGFHSCKAKYIKQAVGTLIQDYGGDIPNTAQEIQKLPGVGPKMTYILESIAFGRCTGIGVDTHMHRIFNQIEWVENTKTPEQTRIQLESWLPKEKWSTINLLFVGFGQEVQQQKEKILRKVLYCSRPQTALDLLEDVGLDFRKECKKWKLEEKMIDVLKRDRLAEVEILG